jgi:hypothetical protein
LTLKSTYALPSEDGHDLREVPKSNDLLVSMEAGVQLFDRATGTFRPHPDLHASPKVKSLDVHVESGRVVVATWKKRLDFLNPTSVLLLQDRAPYKARWCVQPPAGQP